MTDGKYNSENRFVVEHSVLSYEVDTHKVLSPMSFMDWAQELAYRAAEALGFGYSKMEGHRYAWVLSRFHITLLNPPAWRDTVEISTWHKGTSGPFYIRDFMVRGQGGEQLVLGTSSWVVLDEETRGMVRMSDVVNFVPEGSDSKCSAIDQNAPKVMAPRGLALESALEHVVDYQDVDFIGHTNNVRYLSWALDCIDQDYLIANRLKDIEINFTHETHCGETVSLWKASLPGDNPGGSFFVEGRKTDGQVAFAVRLGFEPSGVQESH